jgi:hypothetical protein
VSTLTSPRRGRYAAVAIPLLAVHVVLAVGAVMAVGFSVMGLDPCSYTACGHPRWADIGVNTALAAGVALPVADLVLIIVRLMAGKPAWVIPVVLCIVQVVVAAICIAFVAEAGPL